MLPTYEPFFCPGIKNLSYDKNYALSEVFAGTYTPRETGSIYHDIAEGILPAGDRPLFWSTHAWIWKKEPRDGLSSTYINNVSSKAMMCDMTSDIWNYASITDPTRLGKFFNAVGIARTFQHFNALMVDLSVENPSDRDEEVLLWLWNSDRWAGMTY
jgi:hypothetical protein